MRRKPRNPGTLARSPGRKMHARLRDAAIPAVPTIRAEDKKAAAPPDSAEQESEAEAAVRRMVEAAYT